MRSRTPAALAIVVGMILAPLAAGTVAYAEGDDSGTGIVAPAAGESESPADDEVTTLGADAPAAPSESDVVEPEVVEPEAVQPESVQPGPEADGSEDAEPQGPIEVRPTGWVFEECGTEFDGLLLLATAGIVYSPEGSLVEFEGADYYEYLAGETGRIIVTARPETGYVIVLGDPTEWVANDDGSVTATVEFTDEPCPLATPTHTPTPASTPTAVALAATGGSDIGPLLPLGGVGLLALGTLAAVFGRKPLADRT